MARVNYEKVIHDFQLLEAEEPRRGVRQLREAFQAKAFRPGDFDFGRLFEATFGEREFRRCRDGGELATTIMEEAGATGTSAFQAISGQIVFSSVMDSYTAEDFVFTKMIPDRQTNLSGEKIPGITEMGDEATIVNEGGEFPLATVGESYIETPTTRKRGLRTAVTREAVFFDRTGILLERLGKTSYWLGVNKEKRAINTVIDENDTSARYKFRGDLIQTYGNNSSTHTWDNLEATNALVNHTNIDALEQLFAGMTDPDTGEPIQLFADTLIVAPQLTGTAWRVLNSMMVSLQAGGFATSGNLFRTDSLSPVGKSEFSAPYKLVSTRLLSAQMGTKTSWYLGNISKAFAYMVNWPMRVLTAPPNSHAEFTRDIVTQYRCDEMGAFATIEPRAMCKATVA